MLKNHVKELRISRGWTQDYFSKLIDVSPSTVSSIERGESYPSLVTAYCICLVFDKKFEDVFYCYFEED